MVFLTADIRQGGAIPTHRHPGADEILFIESGTARVHLGDTARVVHGGSTVFIPANTWISVDNIGDEAIRAVAVFSEPGFEEFMRETSVLEGEKSVPLTEAENDAAEKKHLTCGDLQGTLDWFGVFPQSGRPFWKVNACYGIFRQLSMILSSS